MEYEGVRHPFCLTEFGLLDSWDLCTPFIHAMNNMLYMWTKLNHTNLFMNASSSLFKKIRSIVVNKRIWFQFIKKKKKIISFVVWKKKKKN